jgi:hypothetical protein
MDNNKELMDQSSIVDIYGSHWINDLDERKGQSS